MNLELSGLIQRLKVPFRNVFRNRRRTAFSLLIVTIGVAVLLATLAFTDEAITSTKNSLASDSGGIQVAKTGTFRGESGNPDNLMDPDLTEEVVSIIQDQSGVEAVATRLEFGGLIGSGSDTTLQARGIDPDNCIQDYGCVLSEGEKLDPEREDGIVLGEALASELGVGPGDSVDLSFQSIGGGYKTSVGHVIGTANFSNAMVEERLALLPLIFLQKLLGTDSVGRVVIRLQNVDEADEVAASLEQDFRERDIQLETRTWKELNPIYDSLSTFWDAFSVFTYVAVFALVFFSTLEVLTMSFLERQKEVGTVKAVGATRWRVFSDFLIEGSLLGALGGVLGVGAGALIAVTVNLVGITWRPVGATISEQLTLRLTLRNMLFPFLAAVFSTFFGSLFPALKNSKTSIVRALKDR